MLAGARSASLTSTAAVRRLDSPIARVDENNGYGDDAALELALQASLEDAARATPRRRPAPPPGPQLHPFG